MDGELPLGPDDVRLGEIGGAPFYIDAHQYKRWGEPGILIDVMPGAADGSRSKAPRAFASSRRRRSLSR
jgi:uncharacterized protein